MKMRTLRRRLKIESVLRATIKSNDFRHQLKFLSPGQKLKAAVAQLPKVLQRPISNL